MKGNDINRNIFYVCHIVNIFYKNNYMKTLRKGSFLLLAATLGITTLRAQTADEIINKHLDAIGGKTVIGGLKSMYQESTIEVMGTEAPSTTSIIFGKGAKSETDFNGAKIVQCITDKGGWGINPMAGQTTATAMPDDDAKTAQSQLQVGGPLFDYASKGYKAELIGKDTADYKIKLTGSGLDITFFINQKTYFIDKAVSQISAGGQSMERTATFSDYKKTDLGYVASYSQQIVLPQYTLNITVKKLELNKTIDPAIFEMPK
jgi:hypothetical protein